MTTRRHFIRNVTYFGVASRLLSNTLIAQQREDNSKAHEEMVWLDSNENPMGPPPSAIKAMVDGAAATARYHFDEFEAFANAIARSETLSSDQVLFGVGSTEIIDAAISAFTSSSIPMITALPTYDILVELAQNMGRKVVQVPLTEVWAFPVRRLVEEAAKAGGGLIYLCNPNNPTASTTSNEDIDWLVTNLPPHTTLLVDEAYIHFVQPGEVESAIKYVRQGKDVVVTRTFSKIYGMAGARAGFGCARPDLIRRLQPFVDNVVPVLALRAATAALAERDTLVPTRRTKIAQARKELCDWLTNKNIRFIDPHANFVMIDVGRDAKSFGTEMRRYGVVVGRPFPPLNNMLRVSIGTDQEMARFREVFLQAKSSLE